MSDKLKKLVEYVACFGGMTDQQALKWIEDQIPWAINPDATTSPYLECDKILTDYGWQ